MNIFVLYAERTLEIQTSYLKEMANEFGSALFLTRKAPSRGTLISMFSAWLLERLAWYHLGSTKKKEEKKKKA